MSGNFFEVVGRLVYQASLLEYQMKELLIALVDDHAVRILVADFSAAQTEEAIRRLVDGGADNNLIDAVVHATEISKRLRPYRNHILHGVAGVYPEADPREGYILGYEARRGAIRELKGTYNSLEVMEIVDWFIAGNRYVNTLNMHLAGQRQLREGRYGESMAFERPARIELPPALDKKYNPMAVRSWAVGDASIPPLSLSPAPFAELE
jgi:hypothetical protein